MNKNAAPAMSAWDMFRKTGKVSYYMLYSKLKDRDKR